MDTPSSDQSALKGVDGPGGDMGEDGDSMIEIPEDMMDGSGLENCEPGDIYTATVKLKKGDDGKFEILTVSDGKESSDDGGDDTADKRMKLPKSRALSPKESGMELSGGDEE